jgi:hypothetical protein
MLERYTMVDPENLNVTALESVDALRVVFEFIDR